MDDRIFMRMDDLSRLIRYQNLAVQSSVVSKT